MDAFPESSYWLPRSILKELRHDISLRFCAIQNDRASGGKRREGIEEEY